MKRTDGPFVAMAFVGLAALVVLRPGPAAASPIAGTGSLSGMVVAPKAFQAAQVYARNTDKNILYMVYTSGGRYQALNLMPGDYEVTVRKNGFSTDVKKIVVKAGSNATADFSLREGDPNLPQGGRLQGLPRVAFDELYPPGPGRELVQETCVVCHGPNFLPGRQWSEAQWKAALERMMSSGSRAGTQIPPGALSQQDQDAILAYLTKTFGPDSTPKALRIDSEFPLDEQALSRAMYVEYYLPLDPTLDANNKSRRAQDPHFDSDGNVWYTDRSIPNRVGRLDPRTGEFKDHVLPDPKADPHGLSVDKQGHVWWVEVRGFHLGRLDPKRGEMTRYDMNTNGELPEGGADSAYIDSKQNVWFTAIYGNRLGKWDRTTSKIKLWEPPTSNSFPYGILADKKDNIWIAEFHGCKIAKFDPLREKWTEYPALTQPCAIRRLGMDSKGTAWYGVFSGGKLGKIEPDTGKIVEFGIPMPNSQPYDTWPDAEGNVWVSDAGQGGTLIKFDPRTEKFTYYPSPQITDMPKLEITREGAVWYCPRSSQNAAVGVMYPDVTKMTTLGAYY